VRDRSPSRRILITRAAEDSRDWALRLDASGAETIIYPCVVFESLRDAQTSRKLSRALCDADWLVVTSRRGVRAVRRLLTPSLPDGVAVAAVGRATAREARERLGRVDLVPDMENAAALGHALSESLARSGRRSLVVVASGDRAARDLERELAPRRVEVARVIVYRTEPVPPSRRRDDLASLGVDTVLLASPSAATGLANRAIVGPRQRVLSIGPSTTRAARELGLSVDAEARRPALEALMELLR